MVDRGAHPADEEVWCGEGLGFDKPPGILKAAACVIGEERVGVVSGDGTPAVMEGLGALWAVEDGAIDIG